MTRHYVSRTKNRYAKANRIHICREHQSCPILPHCYGPLRAVNGPYVLHKASLLLTVRMLSTNGAWISLLHEGTMRYGSFDPYGPKTYGACISLLHQGRALRFVQSVRSEDIRSVHLIITSGHTALRFVRSVRSARQERRTPTEERF